jgi:hypothetical protein
VAGTTRGKEWYLGYGLSQRVLALTGGVGTLSRITPPLYASKNFFTVKRGGVAEKSPPIGNA